MTPYLSGPHREELRAAIDRLYEAFSGILLSSSPISGCLHCYTQADLDHLSYTPLKLLSHGDLFDVAHSLALTLGTPNDIPYFVPRIVEAIAEGGHIEIMPFADCLAKIPSDIWNPVRFGALDECFQVLFAASEGTWDDLGSEFDENREYVRTVLKRIAQDVGHDLP